MTECAEFGVFKNEGLFSFHSTSLSVVTKTIRAQRKAAGEKQFCQVTAALQPYMLNMYTEERDLWSFFKMHVKFLWRGGRFVLADKIAPPLL